MASNELASILSDNDPETRMLREIVVRMRKEGRSVEDVIERTGLSLDEIALIENHYYTQRQELTERSERIKQLDRLDSLLTIALQQVEAFGLADQKGNFGANLASLITLIREISELAGLKKQEIVQEIRVIEQEQTNVIITFSQGALESFEEKLRPLLTAKGKKELTAHRDKWIMDAIEGQASVLETTVEV